MENEEEKDDEGKVKKSACRPWRHNLFSNTIPARSPKKLFILTTFFSYPSPLSNRLLKLILKSLTLTTLLKFYFIFTLALLWFRDLQPSSSSSSLTPPSSHPHHHTTLVFLSLKVNPISWSVPFYLFVDGSLLFRNALSTRLWSGACTGKRIPDVKWGQFKHTTPPPHPPPSISTAVCVCIDLPLFQLTGEVYLTMT